MPNNLQIGLYTCENCLGGKFTQNRFGKTPREDFYLQLVDSDFCDPLNAMAHSRSLYFITFIDKFINYGFLYFIFCKRETISCFWNFINLVMNQLDRTIKILSTDCVKEYISTKYNDLCSEKWNIYQLIVPYTLQWNDFTNR